MQSSIQQGASERRFDDHFEEFRWENGQLLVATPPRKDESKKPTKGSTIASHFSINTERQSAAKDLTLEVGCNYDRRATELPAHVRAVEMIDWLDDPLDHERSIAMQKNNMIVSSYSYQPSEIVNSSNFLQQDTSLRGDPEGVAKTFCRPSIHSALMNVDAGANMPTISSIQPSMVQEHFDNSSDAMLNTNSLHHMASSPLQQLQNTLFARSSGDAMIFSVPHIDPITNPQGASKCGNSHACLDISRASDLESVLLDSSELTHMSFSCGSGQSPNKGNKLGEDSGNKKAGTIDDFDSESEGSYDDVVALKKPRLEQSAPTKRTRAADTHNQSERKRRGRINEKLKALQELIPNSNKTDKASVLSKAIDYLKELRLKLQGMCCLSGMSISPFLISQGLRHLQAPLAGTGVNHGTEAGMGFGVNATSASFQSFPLSPSVGSAAQVCLGSMGLPDLGASAEAPFTSTNSIHSSGIPATYGSTALTSPGSFHNLFQA